MARLRTWSRKGNLRRVSSVLFHATMVSSKLLNPMSEHLPSFQVHHLKRTEADRKFYSEASASEIVAEAYREI